MAFCSLSSLCKQSFGGNVSLVIAAGVPGLVWGAIALAGRLDPVVNGLPQALCFFRTGYNDMFRKLYVARSNCYKQGVMLEASTDFINFAAANIRWHGHPQSITESSESYAGGAELIRCLSGIFTSVLGLYSVALSLLMLNSILFAEIDL
ncbi:MAG: hypothetical protein PHU23_16285 [Dehalococcoidales bacterium]|nr:hypothetical protein [Dehalococcoidales bacterium]